jgi:hypothetical protein
MGVVATHKTQSIQVDPHRTMWARRSAVAHAASKPHDVLSLLARLSTDYVGLPGGAPLLSPARALGRRNLCAGRSAHFPTFPRSHFRCGGLHRPSTTLNEFTCTAPQIRKLPDEGCQFELELFVPMLSAAACEFKN